MRLGCPRPPCSGLRRAASVSSTRRSRASRIMLGGVARSKPGNTPRAPPTRQRATAKRRKSAAKHHRRHPSTRCCSAPSAASSATLCRFLPTMTSLRTRRASLARPCGRAMLRVCPVSPAPGLRHPIRPPGKASRTPIAPDTAPKRPVCRVSPTMRLRSPARQPGPRDSAPGCCNAPMDLPARTGSWSCALTAKSVVGSRSSRCNRRRENHPACAAKPRRFR